MSPPRFTPRQIDAFVASAELSNFTQAARRLNLTPSAVSNLISELELSLGFGLFERTTRKVTLTPDGREFLPSALAVQRQLQLAAIAAADVRNRSVEVVRVAAPLSVAAVDLPRLIARYRLRQSRVVVRILDTGVEWLADRVSTGEADLALGPDRTVGPDVTCSPLYASPWVLWCSPNHPLARKAALRWTDLEGVDFYAAGHDHEHSIIPRLSGMTDAMRVTPIQIVDNVTTALGIAAAEIGVTFTPDYVKTLAEPLGLVMRRVTDPEVVRHMSLYAPVRRKLSPAALQFHDFVRESLAEAP
ncbi:MAG TPA: LysR family transcriptional regulator [Caulobacteraceae bacterium]|jgi:DNA-binding transcriptional LysR family regulator|nr:LysR family transcriptional regulator [Caulobacteraceae bacterium]